MAKLTIKIQKIEAEGISPQDVLGRLSKMKQNLEELGCKVSINVDGQEIDQIKVVGLPIEEVQS
ncbi:MAG TPA: hypothetical protein VLK33_22930 [Terriglobales bacterium]|nr:hypothetical protein [Terriglobales bacterium]